MASRLIGGSALRARLANVKAAGPDFGVEWADATAARIRVTKPPSSKPESNRFTTKVSGLRAGVYGAFWWIFVDRGTKKHGPKRAQAMRFERGGQTIFTKKVKGMRRRPFISRAAQEALSGGRWADLIIQSWNGKRRRKSRGSFL